ncbi:SlyX family protein [Halomonas sp. LR3S48]|uniref:SlyX family protein n=1 Tax=Halomonas sp. LR3S48 TaxID=2982694 RepID=UPI0021E3B77B|nr:SlyX family protein [Halomonas sp. LR3S48]UYG04267.1 SlyX family protein [Halomonas sp. LR3S48]
MNSDTQRDDSSMSLSQALATRLEALESRIAYQEHWLDTLDEAVASQERRLAQLERINALMQEKLRDQQRALQDSEMAAPSPQDEVPPHY